MTKLLKLMIDKQYELGLNNSQFASKIKVTPQLWGQVKNGVTGLGNTVIDGFGQTFPEYGKDILEYHGVIYRPKFSLWRWLGK